MLTSTFGVIMIVIGGLAALAALESFVMYAASHPTWKHNLAEAQESKHRAVAAVTAGESDSAGSAGSDRTLLSAGQRH